MDLKECKSKHHVGSRAVSVAKFSKHPSTKDRLQSYCKACMSTAQRNWYTYEKQKKNAETWWDKKRALLLEETGIEYVNPSSYERQTLKNESPERYLLRRAKENAKKTDRPFDLDVADISLPDCCPVFGIPLFFSEEGLTENTPSVDRIDSDKGYIKGNIVVVSWRANRIKNNGTPEEHRKVYEFYNPLYEACRHK